MSRKIESTSDASTTLVTYTLVFTSNWSRATLADSFIFIGVLAISLLLKMVVDHKAAETYERSGILQLKT